MRLKISHRTVSLGAGVHVLLEHSNRGKQSLGLDLTSEDGLDILYKLVATCDVFLTNDQRLNRAVGIQVEVIQ